MTRHIQQPGLADYSSLKLHGDLPYCRRCHAVLPRPTNDPCTDPECALGNLSVAALWKILEPGQHRCAPMQSELV